MIVHTEAVVLRGMAFRESSRIVTLFTKKKGKISVLAKGARRMKSQFGSTLQPMSHVQAVYYYRPSRTLQVLSECSHVRPNHRISSSIEKLNVGLRVVELMQALLQEEEPDPQLFRLLVNVLTHLDGAEQNAEHLLYGFQMHLAAGLGFAPDFDSGLVDRLDEGGGLLTLDTGTILPAGVEAAPARPASRAALQAFAFFARSALDAVTQVCLPAAVARELSSLIEVYMRFHVEEAYPVRSEAVFRQMKKRI